MFNFLKKPYPFNDDLRHNSKIIFFITIGIFVFLYVFQPLDIKSLAYNDKLYLIAGIVVITFFSLTLNLMILPSLFPKLFISKKWNIKKEIIWNLWGLMLLSFGNLMYYKFLGLLEFDFYTILQIVFIGIIPISLLITINQDRILRLNLKSAVELNNKLQEYKSIQSKMITFESDYGKEDLKIKVSSLILIKSANNYIEVFWQENGKTKSQMVRSSLIKVEKNLEEYKFIFKSHRSFIVNLDYIERIEGSSQGYKLFFNNIDFTVPVSQKYTNKLREMI